MFENELTLLNTFSFIISFKYSGMLLDKMNKNVSRFRQCFCFEKIHALLCTDLYKNANFKIIYVNIIRMNPIYIIFLNYCDFDFLNPFYYFKHSFIAVQR